MTIHTNFLRRQSRSADTVVAAVADNCRFEERASAARWELFEAMLPGPTPGLDAIDWADWTETNRLYLDRYCNVPSTNVPDAFHDVNRDAWLDAPAGNQSVVRIEDLTRALRFSALSLSELDGLLQRADNRDSDASSAVNLFFETWNRGRDSRPTFAAFYDEVQEEADDADWPHALRDRLGLGHYRPGEDTPIAVALMHYSLEEVFSALRKSNTAGGLRPAHRARWRHARVLLSGSAGAPLRCHRAPAARSGRYPDGRDRPLPN